MAVSTPRPELECKIQKQSTGEWDRRAPGRSGPVSTQYANLLDEADWAWCAPCSAIWASCREAWRPWRTTPPVQCQGAEAAPGHQRPLAAEIVRPSPTNSTRMGRQMRAVLEPGRRGPWRAHRALAQDLWQLIPDAAGAARQAAGPGRPSLRCRPPGSTSSSAPWMPSRISPGTARWRAQGQRRAGPWPGIPSVQLDWREGQLVVQLVTRGGDLLPCPWQGEAMVRQGIRGVPLLAAGSGRREGRGPAPAQPVAHRPAGQQSGGWMASRR